MGPIMNETNAENGGPMPAPEADAAAGQPADRDAFAVVEALNAENSQLKDRVLRTLAEMENLRRRTEREVADAKTYGVTSFARDMLTVVDNLVRALEHLPANARAAADPQIQSVIEGVELTARDLEAALGRHGVRKLDPKGQKFDPNFHQAIFEAPDETLPAGTVSQVVQSGWTIGDRVLRPAMVGVSKGGPKTAPNGEPATNGGSPRLWLQRPGRRAPPRHERRSCRRRNDAAQREVDPPALGEQARRARNDPVDAMEGEARRAAEGERVPRLEAQ
jgi:molecular chaperone GrpE